MSDDFWQKADDEEKTRREWVEDIMILIVLAVVAFGAGFVLASLA